MIYFITDLEQIKIGYSGRKIDKRKKELQTGSSKELYIIGSIEGNKEKEQSLHHKFCQLRQNGEWFKAGEELIEYLNSTLEVYIILEDRTIKWYKKMNKVI
jgi:hypothetical protein